MYILTVFFLVSLAEDMAEVFVNDTIKNNTVVVFSKSYCPFCKMAKQALKDAGLKEVIDVNNYVIKSHCY